MTAVLFHIICQKQYFKVKLDIFNFLLVKSQREVLDFLLVFIVIYEQIYAVGWFFDAISKDQVTRLACKKAR